MLSPMSSTAIRSLALFAAAGAAWGAYELRGSVVASALLGTLCVGLLAWGSIRAGRGRSDVLHDAGVSTLVFPPESRFEQSVLPPR